MLGFTGRVGHLDGIESPWANAGGVVKTTEDVLLMAQTGVGWIEDGSHVRGGKRLGNKWNPDTQQFDRVDIDYNPKTGEMANSLGMPGEGMDAVETEIPERIKIAHSHNKKYVFNIAPVSENPAEETVEMVQRAYAKGVDAVLINAGCPNVITPDGGRHELLSRSPGEFMNVLIVVGDLALTKPVWVRLSPQESYRHMAVICDIIMRSGVVSAVLEPNTWPGFKPVGKDGKPKLTVPGNVGGKSGPAVADAAQEQTDWAVELLAGSNIDVVRSSGITNARELNRALNRKAVAGAGTTFYYQSINGWKEDTDKLLTDLAALT